MTIFKVLIAWRHNSYSKLEYVDGAVEIKFCDTVINNK